VKLEIEVDIREIGTRGDGIAVLANGERVFVPYTVPGDRVRARLGEKRPDGYAGRVIEILAEGEGRATPPCRHFGLCGGCALQHMDEAHYRRWKLARLETALARHGLEAGEIRPLAVTPPGSRRRADFTAVRRQRDLVFGLNARATHQVVDLAECPVLLPQIVTLIPALRELLQALLRPADRADVIVTATDSGLDLVLVSGAHLGLGGRERIAAFAEAADLARVSRRHPKARGGEVLVMRRPVRARFGESLVDFPPGGFLQASAEGEAALRNAVMAAVGPARRIADLYAGCGTFGLPLASAGRQVEAVEGDAHAADALEKAARDAAGRLRLTVTRRDLERRPLAPDELARFDAAVIDPPRAGARGQAEALASSRVPRLAMVSCNPSSFARDARILCGGGYRLAWIQPVDQFLWSPHLELMAAFQA